MGRTRTHAFVKAVATVALAAAIGCRDRIAEPTPSLPKLSCPDVAGTWILVSPDNLLGPRVLVLQLVTDSVLKITELPSMAADGTPGSSLVDGSMRGTLLCGAVDFTAQFAASGTEAWFHVAMSADTARGAVVYASGSTNIFGLRVDPAQLVMGAESLSAGRPKADSTPVLMLRLDDAWAQDSIYLPRLAARGLRAELAIPTSLVGVPTHDIWSHIVAAAQEGFGIAAHSRIHSTLTGPGFAFVVEVLGSMQDLRRRGMPTTVFVQPGSWQDSISFDASAKLANWRGALLRNVARVFEGYVGGWSVPTGRVGVVPLGVTHTTISGYDSTAILSQYQRVFVRGAYTVFLIHSIDVNPPSQLDWLLDSVAAAVAAGRLRTVSIATDLLR